MKKTITSILLIISISTSAQLKINENLKKELIEIDNNDQALRRIYYIEKNYLAKSDSLKKEYNVDDIGLKNILQEKIIKNDSLNMIKIERIIEKFGYPGKSLVGESESIVAWEVIQHSNLEIREKYLNILKNAVEQNEMKFEWYALTIDRILVDNNKPQKYGSQGHEVVLKKNNEKKLIIWPIENAKDINKLRRRAGFKESIKKYAKHLGIDYKIYSLEDIIIK
jgi:hypothetical protein